MTSQFQNWVCSLLRFGGDIFNSCNTTAERNLNDGSEQSLIGFAGSSLFRFVIIESCDDRTDNVVWRSGRRGMVEITVVRGSKFDFPRVAGVWRAQSHRSNLNTNTSVLWCTSVLGGANAFGTCRVFVLSCVMVVLGKLRCWNTKFECKGGCDLVGVAVKGISKSLIAAE